MFSAIIISTTQNRVFSIFSGSDNNSFFLASRLIRFRLPVVLGICSQAVQVVLRDLVPSIRILVSPPFQIGLHVFSKLQSKIGSAQIGIRCERRKPSVGLSVGFAVGGTGYLPGRTLRRERRRRRRKSWPAIAIRIGRFQNNIWSLQSMEFLEGRTHRR